MELDCPEQDHSYDMDVRPFFNTGLELLTRVTMYLSAKKTFGDMIGAASPIFL